MAGSDRASCAAGLCSVPQSSRRCAVLRRDRRRACGAATLAMQVAGAMAGSDRASSTPRWHVVDSAAAASARRRRWASRCECEGRRALCSWSPIGARRRARRPLRAMRAAALQRRRGRSTRPRAAAARELVSGSEGRAWCGPWHTQYSCYHGGDSTRVSRPPVTAAKRCRISSTLAPPLLRAATRRVRAGGAKAFFEQGDDLLSDPPHETQGWYSVYDADLSTKVVLRAFAENLATYVPGG